MHITFYNTPLGINLGCAQNDPPCVDVRGRPPNSISVAWHDRCSNWRNGSCVRWLVLYRQWWVCWGFAYSTYRVAYGVVYRASSVAHFDKEISHSEVIQLSSVVWIYRRALDCYRASSNPLSSFTRVPHDKESAVVQSLKPKVARSVLLDCSFYAVPRGVLKLQSVSSRMPLLQCVVEYCWSIHVGWHRPRRTGRDDEATAPHGS